MDERVERYNVGERFDYNRFFFLIDYEIYQLPLRRLFNTRNVTLERQQWP